MAPATFLELGGRWKTRVLAVGWAMLFVLFPKPIVCLADDQPDPAYLKVVMERAAKIVAKLDIDDTGKAERVRDIIAYQYCDLCSIHETRDKAVEVAGSAKQDAKLTEAGIQAAKDAADAAIYRLHASYLARLSVELSPEQVDGVKDGMTYGVAKGTYDVYLKMCPDLAEEQKKRIKSWLIEARELAMDKGSSKEKHGVFGQYKGKINNYLSAAGYNLKEAEKNLYK